MPYGVYIVKMHMCLDVLSQNKRKSGFGASDELSSEEEEGVQLVEVTHPIPHQERHPAATLPTTGPVSTVRKRNQKPNPKPTVRLQVKKYCRAKVYTTVNKLELDVCYISCLMETGREWAIHQGEASRGGAPQAKRQPSSCLRH